MSSFDKELWRRRARARYERVLSRNAERVKSLVELGLENEAIDSLQVIIDWCHSRGIDVIFTKHMNGAYYEHLKKIRINSNTRPENQLFILLHECGHVLIGKKEKHERFGMGHSQANNPDVNCTFHHRCDILEEEFEAWHRGFKLGRRLKVRVNKKKFDAFRIGNLKTYIDWTMRPKNYIRDERDDTGNE